MFKLVTLVMGAATVLAGSRLPAHTKTESEDKGLMAGLQQGFFLANEAAIEKAGCHVPAEPKEMESMKAMLPMMKMMATNMNNGKEPPMVAAMEGALHQLAIIYAVYINKEHTSEFCKGLIIAEEGRTLGMQVAGEGMSSWFGGDKKKKTKDMTQ